ncbi:MAG: AAA family ATPase, partial [Planctomycetota bacterium]
MVEALGAGALRWTCDPRKLPFESTEQVEPITDVIGQEDALKALRFGLESYAPGQNIFVRGLLGTGRMTMIKRLLREIRPACAGAGDRCYVHNFGEPHRPRLLTLPRGTARDFRDRVEQLADFIRDELPGALQSEPSRARRKALERRTEQELEELTKPFERALEQAGLALVSVTAGAVPAAMLFPVVEGKPVPPEEFEELHGRGQVSDAQLEDYQQKVEVHRDQMDRVTMEVLKVRRRHQERLGTLVGEETRAILASFVRDIAEDFPGEDVGRFLNDVVEDAVKHRGGPAAPGGDFTQLYRVNVVRESEADAPCPIIIENAPTLTNLLGLVDRQPGPQGQLYADHSTIRTGSLLRADGGYLILEARDVLGEPGAWKVLQRTRRTGLLEIVPPELNLPWWGQALKPDPIRISVKVVLLGSVQLYHLLDAYDPHFPHLFKVLADFDNVIPRDDKGLA